MILNWASNTQFHRTLKELLFSARNLGHVDLWQNSKWFYLTKFCYFLNPSLQVLTSVENKKILSIAILFCLVWTTSHDTRGVIKGSGTWCAAQKVPGFQCLYADLDTQSCRMVKQTNDVIERKEAQIMIIGYRIWDNNRIKYKR